MAILCFIYHINFPSQKYGCRRIEEKEWLQQEKLSKTYLQISYGTPQTVRVMLWVNSVSSLHNIWLEMLDFMNFKMRHLK